MVDIRCYECCGDEFNPLRHQYYNQIDSVYIGNGKFKCPRCDNILNFELNTYHTIIAVDIEGSLSTIKTTVDKEGVDTFIEDLQCFDKSLLKKAGVYDCEIYWRYFQSGGCEYPDEWDVEIEFFKTEPIKLPVIYEKPRSWVNSSESEKQAWEILKI